MVVVFHAPLQPAEWAHLGFAAFLVSVFFLSLFLSPYPKSLHPGLGGKQNGEGHSRTWSQTLATTTIVYGLFWWESSERWVSEGRGGYASE